MTLMYLRISSCIPGTIPSGFFPHLILKFIAFLFFKKIYLFIWLHWVLVVARGIFSFSIQTLRSGMWDLVP